MSPETVKVSIRLDDGSTAIMNFLTVGRGTRLPEGAEWADEKGGWWKRPATDALIFGEISRTFPGKSDAGDILPRATAYRIVQDEHLPPGRQYRDAWVDDGQTIAHDMPKAREIHRNLLRHAREAQLNALDVQYMRADEAGDAAKKSEIAKAKQTLRDATKHPDIEAAKTVEALEQVKLGLL